MVPVFAGSNPAYVAKSHKTRGAEADVFVAVVHPCVTQGCKSFLLYVILQESQQWVIFIVRLSPTHGTVAQMARESGS